MNNFQVILLAGGKGERMWPLTVCKSLIHFAGKPIIRYIFDDLKAAGCRDFKIITDKKYLDSMEAEFRTEKVKINFYTQKNIPGMAGAVLSIPDLGSMPTIIVNPEDLVDPQTYVDFLRHCQKTESQIILTGIYKKEYFLGGYFVLKGKKIVRIIEKPLKGSQPSNFVNLVLHYFKNPQLFISYLRRVKSQKDDVYEVALDQMIKENVTVEMFEYKDYWQTIKYPWDILEMMKLVFIERFEEKIDKSAQISSKAIIKDKVVVESGVKIMEGACITGPCYIGRNSIIGNNSLVREANIGNSCVVGFSSEIARSWIGSGCWFHTNYVGDSVLEENIFLGSGAVTANFRFDQSEIFVKKDKEKINTKKIKLGSIIGKNARIGVNVSLMPGILVGGNSWVGSGVVLDKNLEENTKWF